MSASFSRALTEGLSVQMSDAEFELALGASVNSIFKAAAA
jgi:fructose-bisphosphate aldolase class I